METRLYLTPNGDKIVDSLIKYVQQNDYKVSCGFIDIPIATTKYKDKVFSIYINQNFSDLNKEMALIHELCHAEQIVSGVPVRNFKEEIQDKGLSDYFSCMQSLILDAPIHKKLANYGYDLTMITKEDHDFIFAYYSGLHVPTPNKTSKMTLPLRAACLCYWFSNKSYEELMNIVYKTNPNQYDIICKLNSIVVEYVDCKILFKECFNSISSILNEFNHIITHK